MILSVGEGEIESFDINVSYLLVLLKDMILYMYNVIMMKLF